MTWRRHDGGHRPGCRGMARLASGPSVHYAEDRPCRGQCIFFANHGSHLDFVVLWSVLPRDIRARTRPVAARDYWESSRLRQYMATRVFRAVLVDRAGGSLGQLRAQMDQLIAALDEGDSLILFPEGTRGSSRRDRAVQERARLSGPPATGRRPGTGLPP